MEAYVGAITIALDPCGRCGNNSCQETTILDMFEVGCPVCPECGEDLSAEGSVAIATSPRRATGLTEGQCLDIALSISDNMDFDTAMDVAGEANLLWVNCQPEDDLRLNFSDVLEADNGKDTD